MVQIVDCESPLAATDLQALETRIGTSLPSDYRRFLLRYNGGRPKPDTVYYRGTGGKTRRTDLAWFFCLGSYSSENMLTYLDDFAGRIPDDTIPIARDSGGNLFLLSVRGTRLGQVHYWDGRLEPDEGEPPGEDNLFSVAADFRSFIGGLRPYS